MSSQHGGGNNMKAIETVISNKEIARLCIKYLAWDEPVSKRDIELVKPLFQAQAEVSFIAGRKEERDSWLRKTDLEKALDTFTKDIIERAYIQGRREVVDWIRNHPGFEWTEQLKIWGIE